MTIEANRYIAPQAWVAGQWQRDVLLAVGADGHWSEVLPNASAQQRAGAQLLQGPVLPGLVNAHSHAFQRAIAGLTERRSGGAQAADDFWSWRDRMYAAANRISPEQLEAIACQLYCELLDGGYTQVCEFHYLHNAAGGAPYASVAEMSLALVRAARRTGMGLTLLPTLYMRSGFGASGLRDDQARFASTPERLVHMVEELQRQTAGDARINVGVALHSLRAVAPQALRELSDYAQAKALPVHIHIAEQTQEVADCLAHTGQRPIEWLLNHAPLDARWNLVHATHTTPAELAGVQRCGASIVICPSTEANLGDGVFDLPGFAAVGGRWSIGSDSHVTRSWIEELRLLEYSQRLHLQKRNVAAQVLEHASCAEAMFEVALAGGLTASGQALAGLAVGQRADWVTLSPQSPSLLGLDADALLDAVVFSSPSSSLQSVSVAGRCAEVDRQETGRAYVQAMHALWHGYKR